MKKILYRVINIFIEFFLLFCLIIWVANFIGFFGMFFLLDFQTAALPNPMMTLLLALLYYAFPVTYLVTRVSSFKHLFIKEFKWMSSAIILRLLPLIVILLLVLTVVAAMATNPSLDFTWHKFTEIFFKFPRFFYAMLISNTSNVRIDIT